MLALRGQPVTRVPPARSAQLALPVPKDLLARRVTPAKPGHKDPPDPRAMQVRQVLKDPQVRKATLEKPARKGLPVRKAIPDRRGHRGQLDPKAKKETPAPKERRGQRVTPAIPALLDLQEQTARKVKRAMRAPKAPPGPLGLKVKGVMSAYKDRSGLQLHPIQPPCGSLKANALNSADRQRLLGVPVPNS